jgi:hypothetical protein
MVISDDADIAVSAVEGLRRNIKPALSTEPKLSPLIRCPTEPSLLFLAQRISNTGIAQGDYQVGEALSDAYDMRDYDDVDVFDVVVDVSGEEEAYEGEEDESRQEAEIFIRRRVQSGPRVRVMKELSIILMWFPNFREET